VSPPVAAGVWWQGCGAPGPNIKAARQHRSADDGSITVLLDKPHNRRELAVLNYQVLIL
jgi:hypothetical protein